MGLRTYHAKRDFGRTPEPRGRPETKAGWRFVIQKHDATRLHYDFRLELDGVMKSWAVPRGPSLDPAQKRLAVETEDHPIEYNRFEGTIPDGQYGAGPVIVWDRGRWRPREDAREGYRKGRLKFDLEGEKLSGGWMLVRMIGPRSENGKNWLLIKEKDDGARAGSAGEVVSRLPQSVASGRTIEDVEGGVAKQRKAARRTKATKAPSHPRADFQGPAMAGARKEALPRSWTPQLATLTSIVPTGDEWLHEIKFDGYRLVCRKDGDRVELVTRGGQDWTERFPEIAEAARGLGVRRALLDGEAVVLRPDGTTSFQALQNAMRGDRANGRLVYFAFDLLHADGWGLTRVPLEARKQALAVLLGGKRARAGSTIRYSDHVVGQGEAFYAEACRKGLEGIVSKRRDGLAVSGRGTAWLKRKCSSRQEFVIGGFTEPQRSRVGLGALLLGVREDGKLRYAGRVGTGFDTQLLRDLRRRLDALETAKPPFENPPARTSGTHWVRPKLVSEVSFTEWTSDGLLRHPSFEGLREDKKAADVVHERPVKAAASKGSAGAGEAVVAGITLSHPEKVLFAERQLTKRDLARYLETVAPRMVPHLAERPLMILRCPEGRGRECFYQKHPHGPVPPALEAVEIREKTGTDRYLVARDLAGLVSLVQLGALELHVWGARVDRIEQPDRMVFDIDPDPKTPWAEIPRTARRLRDALAAYDLESFVKTTGGKGLHVVVPLRRGPDWKEVGAFAGAVARRLVREDPDLFTQHLQKQRRGGRIFLDTMRNLRAHTWVAAYSPRAREGAPVSCPISWDEVTPKLDPMRFTVESLGRGLPRADPWRAMGETRQTLTAAMLRQVAKE